MEKTMTHIHSVHDGAILLDRVRPGWAAEIDLDHFDMSWHSSCILGQLYGGYQEGAIELFGIDRGGQTPWGEPILDPAIVFGFQVHGEYVGNPEYDVLAELWVQEVTTRLL